MRLVQCRFKLEAHAQMPRHHPVPLNLTDERVNTIQQQLRHCWFS
ncbi:hypothetical protein SynBOUM118_00631 [Synechococcus sp. BOUM118]|nr:hypothetical protein SynBOUM118_00631 [Synechococcus sp. BOUM118]